MISTNPVDGSVVARYDRTTPADIASHIAIADRLQREWMQTDLGTRRMHMLRLADVLESRVDELATLMALEMGKPVNEGRGEVKKCAWACRYYAEEAEAILADLRIDTERSQSYVAYRPLGVILAVMPWNFPLWQVIRFVAPALMAGNAGILKHASNVTGCALAIDEMVVAAGFPDGLFRTVVVPSSGVSEIIDNPLIRAVTLTGSDAAGRAVAGRAGSQLKKTVLELGGADPYLILEDADLDLAVEMCATSRLINGGQSCIAAKRFIVHESIADEFTSRLAAAMEAYPVGDPTDETTRIGPMARVDLRDELHDQVQRSIQFGARVVTGGKVRVGPGAFYPPTVLADVKPHMPVYSEETFGPVATVITVSSEDEAIAVANDSPFGLGAAVFTRDVARGERIARDRIEAGSVFVNAFVASDPRLPFGGIKDSGYGRELSHIGMHEFLNLKTVVVA
ncbi:MAG: NAD-dependent succinate-semialdehyde dehydrogenase [Armatimonadetes bacterium]|nr:MAG: NAD-dependent succinate-semialdehyde dehydrogenase [Armatimonadota bacterium]